MLTIAPAFNGPAGGATDNAIVRWDGATGRLVKNSVLVVADTTGDISGFASGAGLTLHGGGTIKGANGNIGIGTIMPGVRLEVNGEIRVASAGATDDENISLKNATRQWNMRINGVADTFSIRDITAGSIDRLIISNAGNVLIGGEVDSANGRLQLATHTTSAGGLGLGTVTSLFTAAVGVAKLERLSGAGQTFTISALGGGTQSLLFEGSGISLGGIDANAGSLVLRSATGGATVVIQSNGGTAATFDAAQNALFSGNVKSSSATGGIGYAAGAGGTVTQLTSKATGVTLNKATGQIVLAADSLAADTTVTFVLTNTAIAVGDIILLNHLFGGTGGAYALNAQSAAGAVSITVRNITAGALAEAITIGFAVIKAVTT